MKILLPILILSLAFMSCTKGDKAAASVSETAMSSPKGYATETEQQKAMQEQLREQMKNDLENNEVIFPTPTKGTVSDPEGHSNLRSKPTMNSEILGQVFEGEKILLIGKSGNWYKSQKSNGLIGYLHQNLVVVEGVSTDLEADESELASAKGSNNERKNMVREAPARYLSVKLDYSTKLIGGIKNGVARVRNESEFEMRNVVVALSYYTDLNALYTTHKLTFLSMDPYQTIEQAIPNTDRGSYVRYSIVNAYIP